MLQIFSMFANADAVHGYQSDRSPERANAEDTCCHASMIDGKSGYRATRFHSIVTTLLAHARYTKKP
jgi:hypothetical protein